MDFHNSTALVTGAVEGIGRAITIAFAQAGARVMASDMDGAHIKKAVEILRPIAEDRIDS